MKLARSIFSPVPSLTRRRKASWVVGLVILAPAFLAGCATAQALQALKHRPVPVTDPGQRIEMQGFSFLPPQGEGWFSTGLYKYRKAGSRTDRILDFFKKYADPAAQSARGRRLVATAAILDVGEKRFASAEELGAFIDRRHREDFERNPRFRVVKSTYVVKRAYTAMCVLWLSVVEDHEYPGWSGSVFIVDAQAIMCVHPSSPQYLVGLDYQETRLQGDPPMVAAPEVEPFLESLRFTSIQ